MLACHVSVPANPTRAFTVALDGGMVRLIVQLWPAGSTGSVHISRTRLPMGSDRVQVPPIVADNDLGVMVTGKDCINKMLFASMEPRF